MNDTAEKVNGEKKISARMRRLIQVKEPKITTHGLCYRFQVFYTLAGDPEPRSMTVLAETQGEAVYLAQQFPGVEIHATGPGIPMPIDPDRQVFDNMTAAAFLGVEPATVEDWTKKGILPKAKDGAPRFTRGRLVGVALAEGEKAAA